MTCHSVTAPPLPPFFFFLCLLLVDTTATPFPGLLSERKGQFRGLLVGHHLQALTHALVLLSYRALHTDNRTLVLFYFFNVFFRPHLRSGNCQRQRQTGHSHLGQSSAPFPQTHSLFLGVLSRPSEPAKGMPRPRSPMCRERLDLQPMRDVESWATSALPGIRRAHLIMTLEENFFYQGISLANVGVAQPVTTPGLSLSSPLRHRVCRGYRPRCEGSGICVQVSAGQNSQMHLHSAPYM